MHAMLLRTTKALPRSLPALAHPPSRSASVLATSTPPATSARTSRPGSNGIELESSLQSILQDLVGFPLVLPPASRQVPTARSSTSPRLGRKRPSTTSLTRIPLVDQWFENLSGVWPHVLAPPAVATRDSLAALTDLQSAVEHGSSSTALELARSFLALSNISTQLHPRFAAIIATCPLVSQDHHANWDTLVAESVEAAIACAHGSSSTARTIPIQLVAHLARAVGKRQLVSHLTHMDQLLCAFHLHLDPSQLDSDAEASGIALRILHDSLVFMYLRLGQPDRAVHYIEGFVPKALRSEEMVQFLELTRKRATRSQDAEQKEA